MLAVTDVVGELELLTWSGGSGSGPIGAQVEDAYRTIDGALREAGASIVQERVFGDLSAAPLVARARARATGTRQRRVGRAAHLHRGSADRARGTRRDPHPRCARREQPPRHRRRAHPGPRRRRSWCPSGGPRRSRRGSAVIPVARGSAEDARATIDAAEHVLVREGFSYRDVARTWFYLRDILSWYGSFNAVRSSAYRRMGLIGPGGDGAIPASTGIGARAASGWCTLDLDRRPGARRAALRDGAPSQQETERGAGVRLRLRAWHVAHARDPPLPVHLRNRVNRQQRGHGSRRRLRRPGHADHRGHRGPPRRRRGLARRHPASDGLHQGTPPTRARSNASRGGRGSTPCRSSPPSPTSAARSSSSRSTPSRSSLATAGIGGDGVARPRLRSGRHSPFQSSGAAESAGAAQRRRRAGLPDRRDRGAGDRHWGPSLWPAARFGSRRVRADGSCS